MSNGDFELMASGQVDWPAKKKKRRTTPKKDLEDGVKRDCIELLAHLQKIGEVCLYERRNVLVMHTTDGGFVQAGVKGRADIWAVVFDGSSADCPPIPTHVEIECKRRDGKGTLSAAQKDFQAFCKAHGVPYVVVKSAEELKVWLRELGVWVHGV